MSIFVQQDLHPGGAERRDAGWRRRPARPAVTVQRQSDRRRVQRRQQAAVQGHRQVVRPARHGDAPRRGLRVGQAVDEQSLLPRSGDGQPVVARVGEQAVGEADPADQDAGRSVVHHTDEAVAPAEDVVLHHGAPAAAAVAAGEEKTLTVEEGHVVGPAEQGADGGALVGQGGAVQAVALDRRRPFLLAADGEQGERAVRFRAQVDARRAQAGGEGDGGDGQSVEGSQVQQIEPARGSGPAVVGGQHRLTARGVERHVLDANDGSAVGGDGDRAAGSVGGVGEESEKEKCDCPLHNPPPPLAREGTLSGAAAVPSPAKAGEG
ncbi:hypothetical protein ABAZ39_20230 (plasmid) [Azospirillum argentinense]|uniref:Uncharacterized protein n=1 Tax=Azospirillum argentinense TaxID=2970906 RepID=A0A060DMZ2_9PROT|nr:hypothetical protein ABAZ39_20230 [Azospirillum argentinense]EZQ06469.1 hypothetical protein ABAZ39_17870 [Azospirillum argentinense]